MIAFRKTMNYIFPKQTFCRRISRACYSFLIDWSGLKKRVAACFKYQKRNIAGKEGGKKHGVNSEVHFSGFPLKNLPKKPDGYYESDRSLMLKYIPDTVETTLDFGCANGSFSKLLKDKFDVEAWGVEIDGNAAKVASGKLDRVINKDALEALTQLPDNYFDCIIFLDVLEHLVDPYTLLDAVKVKLAEQGVIVASIPNIRYYGFLKEFILEGNWDYQEQGILDKTHLRFFTYKSIGKLFEELKYEILLLEGIGPTESRTCKWLIKIFNSLEDIKFLQYAVIAKPVENKTL